MARHPDRVIFRNGSGRCAAPRFHHQWPADAATIRAKCSTFVSGQVDLKAKVIRAIGDPDCRFTEDKLRMLRAVRFASRFGFEIESIRCAPSAGMLVEIRQVSPELSAR